MAFDQSTLTDASAVRDGADLLVRWSSTAPEGTPFQVYVAGRLAWHGTRRSCVLPYPTDAAGATVRVDVGAVLAAEATTDFSATLPAKGFSDRATLSWLGGTFQSETIAGFRVYMGLAAAAAVSYVAPVAYVEAYPQGVVLDGAGVGGAGRGGAGRSASSYSWRSPRLAAGTWHFGVKPVGLDGNEGAAVEATFAITVPPGAPAPDAAGVRLKVQSYSPTTHVAVLAWLASP